MLSSAARKDWTLPMCLPLSVPRALFLFVFALLFAAPARAGGPERVPANARVVGSLAPDENVSFAFTLPLRRRPELDDLIRHLYSPSDPLYGHCLTPTDFAARFAPTQETYDALARWTQANGLTVTGRHDNRLVLDVSGPAARIQTLLNTRLVRARTSDGALFHAPFLAPRIPGELASVVNGIVGLSDAPHLRPHLVKADDALLPRAAPHVGHGPFGGLTPGDIKSAYNLASVADTGSGQTLALYEADGFTASDIAVYERRYGLSAPPLQTILLDSANGQPGSGADEVTLDIELAIALAPGLSRVLIYETPNTEQGVVDGLTRMASDDAAGQCSSSWGGAEDQTGNSTLQGEEQALAEMAAQGQSFFSASGDSGAYDDEATLSVDDPASQPYATAIGGTSLTLTAASQYGGETTWGDPSDHTGGPHGSGGGGGLSTQWAIPSYQQGIVSHGPAGQFSTTHRNVPDVSLNADPNMGYSIYTSGAWAVYGGTSTGAPLWAGFAALVNQQRALSQEARLGFANPALYALGENAAVYARDFHDIADGSTNLYYEAVPGYDTATGWGSLNGAALLQDLVSPPAASAAPFDFNGDGLNDLLWQNAQTGQLVVWNMSDTTVLAYGQIFATVSDTAWQVAAVNDVNADGSPDLLWQNTQTGQLVFWLMHGTMVSQYGSIFAVVPDTHWRVASMADFNGDGHPDILWENTQTGQLLVWYMNGTTVTQHGPIFAAVPNTAWRVAGTADYNSDGHPDLLWENGQTGQVLLWLMGGSGGTTVTTYGTPLATLSDLHWRIVGTGDTNADGHPDIVWQNTATGQVTRWLTNGTQVSQFGTPFATVSNLSWGIAGIH